jgi:hypothetical protein
LLIRGGRSTGFETNSMVNRQCIAFSLILGPDMHRDLRGKFFLRKNLKPLKYCAMPVSDFNAIGEVNRMDNKLWVLIQ